MDQKAIEKIRNYRKGFEFTIYWPNVPKNKRQALVNVLHYCWKSEDLIEPMETGLGWDEDGEFVTLEETWRRK